MLKASLNYPSFFLVQSRSSLPSSASFKVLLSFGLPPSLICRALFYGIHVTTRLRMWLQHLLFIIPRSLFITYQISANHEPHFPHLFLLQHTCNPLTLRSIPFCLSTTVLDALRFVVLVLIFSLPGIFIFPKSSCQKHIYPLRLKYYFFSLLPCQDSFGQNNSSPFHVSILLNYPHCLSYNTGNFV